MQRAPKRRFRGPRNPKVLRRHLKAVQICLHPSHPSVEWIEIFLWSYENLSGNYWSSVDLKNVLFLGSQKRHSDTRCFAQLSTDKRDHAESFLFIPHIRIT